MQAFVLPPREFLAEGRIVLFVGALILGVDLLLTTLTQEVADELPQDRGSPLLADVGSAIELGEEVFAKEKIYGSHGTMVPDGDN